MLRAMSLVALAGCGGSGTALTSHPHETPPAESRSTTQTTADPVADAEPDAAPLDAGSSAPDAATEAADAAPPIVSAMPNGEAWRRGPARYLVVERDLDAALWDGMQSFRPCGRAYPGECRAAAPTPSTAGTITVIDDEGRPCTANAIEELDLLMKVNGGTARGRHLYRYEGCAGAFHAFLGAAHVYRREDVTNVRAATREEAAALRERFTCRYRVGDLGDAGRLAIANDDCDNIDGFQAWFRADGRIVGFTGLKALVDAGGRWYALDEGSVTLYVTALDE